MRPSVDKSLDRLWFRWYVTRSGRPETSPREDGFCQTAPVSEDMSCSCWLTHLVPMLMVDVREVGMLVAKTNMSVEMRVRFSWWV
jgi:hypothetical protein